MFQRVRVRITMLAVGLLLVLYTISAVATYTIVQNIVLRTIDQRLLSDAQTAWSQGVNLITYQFPAGTFWLSNMIPISLYPTIQSNDMPMPVQRAVIAAINQNPHQKRYFDISVGDRTFRALYLTDPQDPNDPPHFLLVAEDDAGEMTVLNHLRRVLWFVGAAGLVASTLGGFLLADRVLRPIRRAWQRQLEFVADASHELRTPLAVIQSNLGIVMEHTDQSVVDNLEWLNHAHGEARRLTKLVQDLLTLARSDSERAPIARAQMDLRDLVAHVHELYEGIARLNGIDLEVDASKSVEIQGDRDRLHQLLVILLDNAFKFTPAGGSITIRLGSTRSAATLDVIDTGQGIAAEDLPRVFERFFTADRARARGDKSSAGLGLSIARWIVDAHNGKIGIASKGVGRGTTVHVELPLS